MKREALLDAIDPYKRTKMMVEIEDYGQERILPSLKQNRPNAGYSNLSVRNMYIVNPTQRVNPECTYITKPLEAKEPMKSAPFVCTTLQRIGTCAR